MNIFTWTITICIGIAPWLVVNLYRKYYLKLPLIDYFPTGKLLIMAAILYPVARFVPEPDLFNDTRTFFQHLIGGGFVSFLYFLYCNQVMQWKLSYVSKIVVIYAFVASLGVANELLEFAARSTGIYDLDSSDAWYDLFANTVGAFTAYGIYSLATVVTEKKR